MPQFLRYMQQSNSAILATTGTANPLQHLSTATGTLTNRRKQTLSATFMKNLKKKTVGVACITALTLGTGTAGVVALNAAHAAEASASATTNQARTNLSLIHI